MLLSKITIVITALFSFTAAVVTDNDYLNAAAKRSNGLSANAIRANLTASGQKAKIDAALADAQAKGKFGGAAVCDLKCPACATCNRDLTNVGIEIAVAWATCAIACFTVVGCPEAIAAAGVATSAICAKFCNDHKQGLACKLDCAWEKCTTQPAGKCKIEIRNSSNTAVGSTCVAPGSSGSIKNSQTGATVTFTTTSSCGVSATGGLGANESLNHNGSC